ncbi:MAG: HAMP domain-containing sensor histidine kinase [Trueperaceae bacterium]|nr:HAMP domain-containing sensor histidine kinase [Trueperaceae bacterium]
MTQRSDGDAARTRPSLFWRFVPSYLLVAGVATVTALVAGESLAPFLLDRHMRSMTGMMDGMRGAGMTQTMLADLETAYRQALTSSLLWASGASLLASAAVALFVTRRIVRPMRAVTRASSRIAGGSYRERLDAEAPGELGELAEAFNAMAATLERSEARRVQLLGDVAHEFRTPLSNLKGYLEGLEDGVFEPDAATLSACTRQVTRLGRLVDDLSLLSRVETGQLDLAPSRLAVRDVLADAAEAFGGRFEQKGVVLELEPPSDDEVVRADPLRTAQVVANLLANALRHTPAGGRVTLSAERLAHEEEVRFEVRDEGEGIDQEHLPHVFDRFYRADRSRRHAEGSGSGIGLTLVKQLVERQGGRVGAQSVVGQGASFWFTLPRSQEGHATDSVRG